MVNSLTKLPYLNCLRINEGMFTSLMVTSPFTNFGNPDWQCFGSLMPQSSEACILMFVHSRTLELGDRFLYTSSAGTAFDNIAPALYRISVR